MINGNLNGVFSSYLRFLPNWDSILLTVLEALSSFEIPDSPAWISPLGILGVDRDWDRVFGLSEFVSYEPIVGSVIEI